MAFQRPWYADAQRHSFDPRKPGGDREAVKDRVTQLAQPVATGAPRPRSRGSLHVQRQQRDALQKVMQHKVETLEHDAQIDALCERVPGLIQSTRNLCALLHRNKGLQVMGTVVHDLILRKGKKLNKAEEHIARLGLGKEDLTRLQTAVKDLCADLDLYFQSLHRDGSAKGFEASIADIQAPQWTLLHEHRYTLHQETRKNNLRSADLASRPASRMSSRMAMELFLTQDYEELTRLNQFMKQIHEDAVEGFETKPIRLGQLIDETFEAIGLAVTRKGGMLAHIWNKFTANPVRGMTPVEFEKVLQYLDINPPDGILHTIFRALDKNGDGHLTLAVLEQAILPDQDGRTNCPQPPATQANGADNGVETPKRWSFRRKLQRHNTYAVLRPFEQFSAAEVELLLRCYTDFTLNRREEKLSNYLSRRREFLRLNVRMQRQMIRGRDLRREKQRTLKQRQERFKADLAETNKALARLECAKAGKKGKIGSQERQRKHRHQRAVETHRRQQLEHHHEQSGQQRSNTPANTIIRITANLTSTASTPASPGHRQSAPQTEPSVSPDRPNTANQSRPNTPSPTEALAASGSSEHVFPHIEGEGAEQEEQEGGQASIDSFESSGDLHARGHAGNDGRLSRLISSMLQCPHAEGLSDEQKRGELDKVRSMRAGLHHHEAMNPGKPSASSLDHQRLRHHEYALKVLLQGGGVSAKKEAHHQHMREMSAARALQSRWHLVLFKRFLWACHYLRDDHHIYQLFAQALGADSAAGLLVPAEQGPFLFDVEPNMECQRHTHTTEFQPNSSDKIDIKMVPRLLVEIGWNASSTEKHLAMERLELMAIYDLKQRHERRLAKAKQQDGGESDSDSDAAPWPFASNLVAADVKGVMPDGYVRFTIFARWFKTLIPKPKSSKVILDVYKVALAMHEKEIAAQQGAKQRQQLRVLQQRIGRTWNSCRGSETLLRNHIRFKSADAEAFKPSELVDDDGWAAVDSVADSTTLSAEKEQTCSTRMDRVHQEHRFFAALKTHLREHQNKIHQRRHVAEQRDHLHGDKHYSRMVKGEVESEHVMHKSQNLIGQMLGVEQESIRRILEPSHSTAEHLNAPHILRSTRVQRQMSKKARDQQRASLQQVLKQRHQAYVRDSLATADGAQATTRSRPQSAGVAPASAFAPSPPQPDLERPTPAGCGSPVGGTWLSRPVFGKSPALTTGQRKRHRSRARSKQPDRSSDNATVVNAGIEPTADAKPHSHCQLWVEQLTSGMVAGRQSEFELWQSEHR